MALEREVWQAFITNNSGDVQPNAQITVFDAGTSNLSTIYSGLTGAPRSNPFNTGSDGLAKFYAEPARYRVQAQTPDGIAVFDDVDLSQKALREDLSNPGSEVLIAGEPAKDVAALRSELHGSLFDGEGALAAKGAMVFVDKESDLSLLPSEFLNIGQQVSVGEGFEYRWNGSEFELLERSGLKVNKTIEVSASDSFLSAVEKACLFRKIFKSNDPVIIEVKLKSGFVMSEQLFVTGGQDLSFIRITSEDPVVTISRQDITINPTSENLAPIFFASGNSKLPNIRVKFEYDNSGVANGQSGIWVGSGSSVVMSLTSHGEKSGVTHCPARGLHVSGASQAFARNTDFSFSGVAFRISNGSFASIRNAVGKGCPAGLAADSAFVDARGADLSECIRGIRAIVSFVNFRLATAKYCTMSGLDIEGGYINFSGTDISGTTGDAEAGGDGAAIKGSQFNGEGAIANGCARVAYRISGSTGSLDGASGTDSNYGIRASASFVSAVGFDASRSAFAPFESARGAVIAAENSIADDSADGIVRLGGTIIAHGSSASFASTVIPNIPSQRGVVYSEKIGFNQGRATIESGQTFVSVLPEIFKDLNLRMVQVTPSSNMGDASKFWVRLHNSSEFRINIDQDAGADVSFSWSVRAD